MLTHTNPDSFGKNLMDNKWLTNIDSFYVDSFNFFNIKSLDDTRMPIGPTEVISGLSTREQGGVNTIGFNYFDRIGGKMLKQPLIALTALSILNSNPLPLKVLKVLSEINALSYGNPVREIHGSDVICHFETENRIGIAWLELHGDEWSYNYMRFDTLGEILLDLRNFKLSKWYGGKYGIDWEFGVPTLDYVTDNKGNSWLVYSYDTDPHNETGWRIGFMMVNSNCEIVEHKSFEHQSGRCFLICPSSNVGFHILWGGTEWGSLGFGILFNRRLSKPVGVTPTAPNTLIEITGERILMIIYDAFSRCIYCRRISGQGVLLSMDSLNLDEITSVYWKKETIDLPEFYELCHSDSLIYYIQSTVNSVRLVIFDKNGKVIIPKEQIKGEVLDIGQMPNNATRFIKIRSGIIYYFGFDDKGNLYYWCSKEKKE